MSDPKMSRNMAEARSDFEQGNQAEGKDGQTQRQTDTRSQAETLPGATEAGPTYPSPTCGRSLHPVPLHSRTSSRMRSCFGKQLREDEEQVWM